MLSGTDADADGGDASSANFCASSNERSGGALAEGGGGKGSPPIGFAEMGFGASEGLVAASGGQDMTGGVGTEACAGVGTDAAIGGGRTDAGASADSSASGSKRAR
jgi:hypothetical protein